jgi:hypothetical protein
VPSLALVMGGVRRPADRTLTTRPERQVRSRLQSIVAMTSKRSPGTSSQ